MDGDKVFDTRGADPERLAFFRGQAELLHGAHQQGLPVWAVFGPGTDDYPGVHVARCGLSLPQPQALKLAILGNCVDDLRQVLPGGLVMFVRTDKDPPYLIESWL